MIRLRLVLRHALGGTEPQHLGIRHQITQGRCAGYRFNYRSYPVPNVIEEVKDASHLSRDTVWRIFTQAKRADAAIVNPHEFIAVIVRITREELQKLLVEGIQYQRIDEWYDMELFDTSFEPWEQYLVEATKSIYECVRVDSGVEQAFVSQLEADTRVKLYVKLPSWFTVPTPVGEYNPDWAILWEEHDEFGEATEVLYLVSETKYGTDLDKLRPSEKRLIQCGEKHFEQLGGVR